MEFHPKSCIRGYHEYGEQWDAFLGEQLICQCKVDNVTERYAVNVKKDSSKTVGHMLKKISRVSSAFLQHGFIITATVSGHQINWNIWHLRDFEYRACTK